MEKSKYFLTIDVGTKNLALCLTEYRPNINSKNLLGKINIIYWKIIDVSYKPLLCKQIKNKRAICNCQSKYYSVKQNNVSHSDPDNLIGYCKNHYGEIKEYNKKKENKFNQIKTWLISSNPIYKNNFSTQMEKLLYELNIFFSEIISKPYHIDKKGNCLMVDNLNIYIENQPVLKNPIMKSISVGIYTFFCMNKILYPKNINGINFINATTKTKKDFIVKLSELIELKLKMADDDFEIYKKRKDFSENVIEQIIPKLNNDIDFINNSISISNYILAKKKDDLADALLYQIYIMLYLI